MALENDKFGGAERVCAMCGAPVPAGFERCRAVFEEVCAREYSDPAFQGVHLLTVDAYALQHSDECGPRSNAFHLMRLCLLLEHDGDPRLGARPPRAQAKAFEHDLRGFPFLTPPSRPGTLTVADVIGAQDSAEHSERVWRWARSVWDAWEPHHAWARETAQRHAR
ncbi:MAG TPA: DUF5946 family protein [Planctomycetota bacterium]|nr:DUF5946 family protein [Planctomycetota bacterium]